MLDWLKRDPFEAPAVPVGERMLPLVIRRHARARRMTLRLSPDGTEARVTIPNWGRTADAIAFASSRADWLARQLEALPDPRPVVPGATLSYRGEALRIAHDPAFPRTPVAETDRVILGGAQASIPGRLKRWLQGEALDLLAADLSRYCERAKQRPPRLALSNARRRWGSCAPDGSIRINWRLIMAPDEVRRSVVAHEVAHLVHFDHSGRFYALLAEIFEGDLESANAWLKREGPLLYQPFG